MTVSVRSDLAAVEAQLSRRRELCAARSALELLQQLAGGAAKLDKLMAELGPVDDLGNGEAYNSMSF